ncbi:MAG: hypothetical protein M3464_16560 [Chloroflexota bacterium]|nr:hypothetical protein [Chloroflexota bacterium]
MTVQETYIEAEQALQRVVAQIRDDQWDMPIPESFQMSTSGAAIATLRDVINYHAYDTAWLPDMLAGKTMDEAGPNQFDGDLLGDAPKESFLRIGQRAIAAVRDLDDLERTVHYTYGDYPAAEAIGHAIIFRGLRAHDLADVIGVDSTLPDSLVQGLWDVIAPQAEELRAIGVFAPAVAVPEDAPLQDRLLGLTGRHP